MKKRHRLETKNNLFISFQNVSGQVVLITGGGGGVGRHLALNFARLNSKVVIWDINREGKWLNAWNQ